MKDHRKWYVVASYFRDIPIHTDLIDTIRDMLYDNRRVLIMVLKEDEKLEPAYTIKEKQEAICDLFSDELVQGKVLVVHVPDIQSFARIDL